MVSAPLMGFAPYTTKQDMPKLQVKHDTILTALESDEEACQFRSERTIVTFKIQETSGVCNEGRSQYTLNQLAQYSLARRSGLMVVVSSRIHRTELGWLVFSQYEHRASRGLVSFLVSH